MIKWFEDLRKEEEKRFNRIWNNKLNKVKENIEKILVRERENQEKKRRDVDLRQVDRETREYDRIR